MPRNVYSEINLHIVWHTKDSRHLIKPGFEKQVHDFVRRRRSADGVFVHEIGGTTNHVHLAAAVPPTLLVSRWIGQVKGGSSHDVNEQLPAMGGVFEWQAGYGVVSFGTKDLPWVTAYVRDQKRHHEQDTWQERLERITRRAPDG